MNDDAVEAMVYKNGQIPEQPGEQFHRNYCIWRRKSMGRKTIKREPGKRHRAGKDFHLADEIRYIQGRAAEHDGRFVMSWSRHARVICCPMSISAMDGTLIEASASQKSFQRKDGSAGTDKDDPGNPT
jgi:hypothetical protein